MLNMNSISIIPVVLCCYV